MRIPLPVVADGANYPGTLTGGVAEFRKLDVADRADVVAFANFAKEKLAKAT